MSNPIIQLSNITKTYRKAYNRMSIGSFLARNSDTTKAINDLSITISKGEKVGIIGDNGSGKTTLLKIIAGIVQPDSGRVSLKGRVVSLIGLGSSFNNNLTGRDNIFLHAQLIGMNKKEIFERFDEIVTYSGIGDYIEEPVEHYSDGMRLRLSVAISIFSKPDIFLIDEGFYAGDVNFRKKMRDNKTPVFNKQRTVIMVTHNVYAFFDFCDRVIVLDKGRIIYDGGLEAIKYYNPDFEWYSAAPEAEERLKKAVAVWSKKDFRHRYSK